MRVEARCGRSSKTTVFKTLYEVAERCRTVKAQFMHMPTQDMIDNNARAIYNKYRLFNVAGKYYFNVNNQCNSKYPCN